MANILNQLTPSLYEALDRVSRELVGFVPSVSMDNTAARAALGDAVEIFKTTKSTSDNITPAMNTPEPTDRTVNNVKITMTKAKKSDFGFVGEEQLQLNNGTGYNEVQVDMIAQAMRTLVNEVEVDVANEYKKYARVVGVAGTTPFGSNFKVLAEAGKVIKDNGGWVAGEMNGVMSTTAHVNLGTLTNLTNVNEAGETDLLRQGIITRLLGFNLRESAANPDHTKGTGTGYLVNNVGGLPIGATNIAVDTGTGTIVAGDVITFAGDSNKYVVTTGIAAPGTVVIAAPGLQVAVADDAAVTVGDDYEVSVATFRKGAIQLATRAPAIPVEGDSADDRMMITDDRSGLTFDVSVYKGYKKVSYEIALVWGVQVIKPEDTAIILG